ncbi:MAG: hypothetical protein ACU4F9_11340 [Arcticibacter sp.]
MASTKSATAQRVRDRFELLTFSDNFDTPSEKWTTEANSDNLLVIQDGEYILHRKNTSTPFLVIAGLEKEVDDCRLVASLRLDKNYGSDPTAGILFMMQPQASGGFLIELNKKKEFRVRQITAGKYQYLTGTSKNGGWTKCASANEAGLNNVIEIRTAGGNYDLYINDVYLISFFEPSYKSGSIGIVIGPDTRTRLDYVYIFTKGPTTSEVNTPSDSNTEDPSSGEEMIKLAESIIQLKTQINALKQDNDELKKAVSSLRSGESEKSSEIKSLEAEIKSMQDQIASRDAEIAKLVSERDALAKYKEMTGGNENSDVIITLSKALKAEKEKNLKLEEELRRLKMEKQ